MAREQVVWRDSESELVQHVSSGFCDIYLLKSIHGHGTLASFTEKGLTRLREALNGLNLPSGQ